MPESFSFTTSGTGPLRVLANNCQVSKAWSPVGGQPPPLGATFRAIWDTGATRSVISQNVISACELAPISATKVYGVDGPMLADVFLVNIVLPNKVGFPELTVTAGKLYGADLLIGMDIIGKGDFAVSHPNGNTKFSFRMPSQADIDFVKESRLD